MTKIKTICPKCRDVLYLSEIEIYKILICKKCNYKSRPKNHTIKNE